MNIQPVVLGGGRGTRLWPLSRAALPKQLLQLQGKTTLLQKTLARIYEYDPGKHPIVVVGEEHRYLAKRQIDELSLLHQTEILIEPLGRSTAPAICGAVIYVSNTCDAETLVLILPSDHLIEHNEKFIEGIQRGAVLAREGAIVTFGIPPDRPETGYGYIQRGDDDTIISFHEKPPFELAEQYLAASNYYWNSGIFLFKPVTFFEEMQRYCPEIVAIMSKAVAKGAWDGDFFRFDAQTMLDVPDTSIDYALMEKTDKGRVIPVAAKWRDLGSWFALWQEREKDQLGNVCEGNVLETQVNDSFILGEEKLVVAVGLENMLVVESGDALLVSSLSAVQDVKKVVEKLQQAGREEWVNRNFSLRPWGSYLVLEKHPHLAIRRVVVHPGMGQDLQRHEHRTEHWVVVAGTARVTRGFEIFLLHEDQSCIIPAGVIHRLENPGILPLQIIEIQTGDCADDDVEHYPD